MHFNYSESVDVTHCARLVRRPKGLDELKEYRPSTPTSAASSSVRP